MPELRSGLLWRMDARTPKAAAEEWKLAKARFTERTGTIVKRGYAGFGSFRHLRDAVKAGLTAVDYAVDVVEDKAMPDYEILLTGDEPAAREEKP